jgi:Calcium-activated chloride channel
MMGFWDRQVLRHQLVWGMTEFSHIEIERADYEGEEAFSPINGKLTTYFNPTERSVRISVVRIVIGIAILAVIAIASVVTYIGATTNSTFASGN